MEQPELERPPTALEPEGLPGRLAFPDRFVHEEIPAVEPPGAGDLAFSQVRKQRFVEGPRVLPSARRPRRPADDVVPGVGSEGREHPLNVVSRLEPEMLVDLAIHLRRCECHGAASWKNARKRL